MTTMHHSSRSGRRVSTFLRSVAVWTSAIVVFVLAVSAEPVQAQRAAQTASPGEEPFVAPDPSSFGLEIPDAPPRPGRDRRVLVTDANGKQVVAKMHVEVADRGILLLPNGRLVSKPLKDTPLTAEPFRPVGKQALIDELTSTTFKGFKTRSTNHYVYIYNTSEVFAKGTSAILETMYPGLMTYLKRSKLDVHEAEIPLPVIMFRTEEDFQKYQQMPQGVVAYYDGISNYVIMYEQSRLGDVAPDLAVKQAISTVAHEGVHQVLHNVGVQQRLSRWPMWISEGLPEYFSPTEVKARRWKGVGQPNDMRLYELGKYLEVKGGATKDGQTIQDTVRAPRLTSTGYASAWGLTHYLAKTKEKEFFGYLREISEIGPLEGHARSVGDGPRTENLEVFGKHFGTELGRMEEQMIKHLQRLPYADPIANQTHYVVRMMTDLGGSIQTRTGVTTSPQAVAKWQQEMSAEVPVNLRNRSRFTVHTYPNRDAALQAAGQ